MSGDVIRAQEAIVKKYDDQIAAIQTQADWIQLEIDQRKLQVDLIRDQTAGLEDELDAVNDVIDARQDEIDAIREGTEALEDQRDAIDDVIDAIQDEIDEFREGTEELEDQRDAIDDVIDAREDEIEAVRDSAKGLRDEAEALREGIRDTEDLIEAKEEFIGNLNDPKLQGEINKLKTINMAYLIHRDKLQLRIDKSTPFKTANSTMMDPLLQDLKDSATEADLAQQRLDYIKSMGVIDAKLKLNVTPSLAEILFLLEAIKQNLPTESIQRVINMARNLRAQGVSEADIAAQIAALAATWGVVLPAFQHGGVVTRPTVGLIAERGPEAVIPLNRALPQGMAGNNVTINIEGFVGDPDELTDMIVKRLRRELR